MADKSTDPDYMDMRKVKGPQNLANWRDKQKKAKEIAASPKKVVKEPEPEEEAEYTVESSESESESSSSEEEIVIMKKKGRSSKVAVPAKSKADHRQQTQSVEDQLKQMHDRLLGLESERQKKPKKSSTSHKRITKVIVGNQEPAAKPADQVINRYVNKLLDF